MLRFFVFCIAIVMLSSSLTRAQMPLLPDSSGTISFIPLIFKSNKGVIFSSELGQLSVPANRSGSSGKTITLPILKLKSKTETPAPPIVYLADGPGGMATNEGFVLESIFQQLIETHDIILMDQRGTGRSKPMVYWEAPNALPTDYFLSYENMLEQDRWSDEQAVAHFRRQDIDLRGYNSIESADDLNDLCLALGVEKFILIGYGYGSHLALATIRRHPDIVHSAVLAGTAGPDHSLKLPSTYDAQLNTLSDLAAQDPAIRAKVPSMAALLRPILNRVDINPITVSIRDRKTRKMVNVLIGKFGLQWILARDIGNGKYFQEFPALLYTMSRGDYSLLRKYVEKWYNELGRGVSGMSMMITLHGGATPERLSRIMRESGVAVFGNAMNAPDMDLAGVWGNPNLGNSYRSPITTDVKTLFISGTLDSTAPSPQTEEIRQGFSSSAHCIVRWAGHEDLLSNKQVQQMILDFINGKDMRDVQISLGKPKFTPIP